jgi:hypothetical protein
MPFGAGRLATTRDGVALSDERPSNYRCVATTNALRSQLVEQGVGLLQVGRIQAFTKPTRDLSEQFARLITAHSGRAFHTPLSSL